MFSSEPDQRSHADRALGTRPTQEVEHPMNTLNDTPTCAACAAYRCFECPTPSRRRGTCCCGRQHLNPAQIRAHEIRAQRDAQDKIDKSPEGVDNARHD